MNQPTREEVEAAREHYKKLGFTDEEFEANRRMSVLDHEASQALGTILFRFMRAGVREEDVVATVRSLYRQRESLERLIEREAGEGSAS